MTVQKRTLKAKGHDMECPVCHWQRISGKEFSEVDGVKYYECHKCGLLFAAPDFLEDIDSGRLVNYQAEYWLDQVEAAKKRSYGSSIVRICELFYYSRIKINKLIDIGTGPGYLLDAVDALMPCIADAFHGLEMYPPDEQYRTKHKNYHIGDFLSISTCFDAGTCIEVIEHLTPKMLTQLAKSLAQVSNHGAVYYFNSGQPDYVKKENPLYLNPYKDGHIASYSISSLEYIFRPAGFKIIPLYGRSWAFLAEYQSDIESVEGPDEILSRIWHPVKENMDMLSSSVFGQMLLTSGRESARCYLEHAISKNRAKWAKSLQDQVKKSV